MSSGQQQPSSSSSESQPSMLGGHVKYVQGAISSAVGYESEAQTKAEAVQEMNDAKAQSDPSQGQPTQSSLLGMVENAAGKVTGCEGMVDEGKKRMPEKRGVEEQSGTG